MRKDEFQIKEQKQSLNFIKSEHINGKDQNLTVVLRLNHNKGLIDVSVKWSDNMIPEDGKEAINVLKSISDLMLEAKNYGLKWKKERAKAILEEAGMSPLFDDEGNASPESALDSKTANKPKGKTSKVEAPNFEEG